MTLDWAVLLGAAAAGALYILAPGPAVLALIAIGAARGRRDASAFVAGHLAGDLLWCGLALVAIIGAHVLDPRVFHVLAVACGIYLGWLGLRALATRPAATQADVLVPRRPLIRGLIFGLTNPKSYPVALAMFTALLATASASLRWADMPPLLAAAIVGCIAGNVVLVWLIGTGLLRRLYVRHAIWIIRATGALFVFFAATTLWQAIEGLMRAA
jgi:threonine/homoserine/homoserine lactone efflux protein